MSNIERPKQQSDDSAWIRRCQAGDAEAFGPLVDRYQSWVFAHCHRWVGDSQKAEDLAQEVFIKAFAKIKKFRGDAQFSTWLFKIMRNQCLDFYRKRENRKDLSKSLDQLKNQPALSPQAESNLSMRERNLALRQAVSQLPKIYQEALLMRYFNEQSYEEMAMDLGQKESALKMRVARGLDMLRTKLKGGV